MQRPVGKTDNNPPYAKPNFNKRSFSSPNTFDPKKICTKPTVFSPKKPAQFYQGLEVKLSLYDFQRFTADSNKFSSEIIDVYHTINSKWYNPNEKCWVFGISDYHQLVTKLMKLPVKIEEIPDFVLNGVRQHIPHINIDTDRLDPELNNALMPFQRDALQFAVDRGGRCLLADDMGLGKTFQALAIANYYQDDWPLLISTTKTMKTMWEDTIHQYLPTVPYFRTQILNKSSEYIADETNILIINHSLLPLALENLVKKKFGVIIIDESHQLKSYKGKSKTAGEVLCRRAKRRVLLSGTPALSRPSELYPQLTFIADDFFGSNGYFTFTKRFCDGKQGPFGWDASGKSNLKELDVILRRKFMVRRLKDDILKQLPKKEQHVIQLDVRRSKMEQSFTKLAKEYSICEKLGKKKEQKAVLMQYFSESAKVKMDAVSTYLLGVLEQDKKFIVFGHHKIMLDAIESVVKDQNVGYIRIDGQTNQKDRQKSVELFQENDRFRCAILSINATNAGFTLTAAKIVIFAELHWCPGILCQAESRAHRIGQEDTVKVYYLVASDTADDYIWPMLKEKQENLQKTGLTTGFLHNNVSVDKQVVPISNKDNVEDDVFNDGLDEAFSMIDAPNLNCSNKVNDDFFNDGLDEVLGSIEF